MVGKPYCFLHIPRTAGTTLNTVLKEWFRPEETLTLYTEEEFAEQRELPVERFESIRLIQGHIILQYYNPPRVYSQEVNVFTFLREPVARIISEYSFLKTWEHSTMYAVINDQDMSFAEYITSDRKEVVFKGKNFMTRALSGEDTSTDRAREKALSKAMQHLEKVFGFFGIQEMFDESLVMLSRFLGVKPVFYERRNVLKRSLKPLLSEEDIGLAREYNSADRALYDFALELFRARMEEGGKALQQEMALYTKVNSKFQNVCDLIEQRDGLDTSGNIRLPKA